MEAIGPKKAPARRRWALLVLVFVVVGVAFSGIQWWRNRQGAAPRFEYVTAPAVRGTLRATVTATGTLKALDQVDVGAEVSGKVRKVFVDFNERVEADQPLCEIDAATYRAARDQARAQLAASEAQVLNARASVDEARVEVERSHALAREGLTTAQQVVAAEATLKRAEASHEAARSEVTLGRAALKSAQTMLDKTVIKSPIAGIVLSRQVEPGQTLAASFQAPVLFTLARDLTKMELEVSIDEADVGQVREGQPATFTVDTYPDRVYSAELTSIHNTASVQDNVVSYQAILRVDNRDASLRPGMTATVTVTTGTRENALLVPNAALRFTPPSAIPTRGGGPPFLRLGRTEKPEHATRVRPENKTEKKARVWLADGDTPKAVSVRTGLSDGEHTEVLDTKLKPGARLIIDMVEGG